MSYFFVGFEGRGKQYDIAIGEPVGEVEFVIAAEDEVEIEALGRGCSEVADEAGVGLMVDLPAQLFILLENLGPHHPDIAHL